MIEQGVVDGHKAWLMYVNDSFEPVDKDDATLLVANLDDGRKLVLRPPMVLGDATTWREELHSRVEGGEHGGEFGSGSGTSREEKSKRAIKALSAKVGMAKATPDEFVAARDKSQRSQFLSAHPAEELAGHTLLLNDSDTVGISVDKDGDVQNVFNNGGPKGGAAKAMVAAIANDGRTLDCYDGFLPTYYHQFGFAETNRMKFNPEFAPEGWDFDKYDNPDIVFMSWQGFHEGGAAGALSRAADRATWKAPAKSTEYTDDWDAAKEASRQAAKRRGAGDHRDAGADARRDDGAGNRSGLGAGAGDWRTLDAIREWNEEKHSRVEGGATAGQFGSGTGPATERSEAKKRTAAALSPKIKARNEAKRQAERAAQQQAAFTQGQEEKKAAETEAVTPSKEKKIVTKEAFQKAKLRIRHTTTEQDAFVTAWNEKIGMDPEEFAKTFTGGLQDRVELSVGKSGAEFQVTGIIKDEAGRTVGNFDRDIKPDKKEAYSAYFKLERAATGDDTGKRILGGNIEAYEAMGITTVRVTANIDVGGYAWAKYGYVPTAAAWSSLSSELERKLDRETGEGGTTRGRSTSSDTMEADSWEMLSSDQQEETFRRWARDSRDEFLSNEIDNWRESGQALEQSKRDIAERFNNADAQWAMLAMTELRAERTEAGEPDIPYSDDQIMEALTASEYESNYQDGRDDFEFEWNDDKLQQPSDFDPNQTVLPGFEEDDKSTHLTQDMRDAITDKLVSAANSKADDDADDMEPPDYLGEQVEEYQQEYWDQKDDDEKLREAIGYGQGDIEIESEDEDEEEPEMDLTEEEKEDPEIAELYDLVRSGNPKSIWKIADSTFGKKLLLNSGWSGVLDLKDKESYARFKAYVGKGRK